MPRHLPKALSTLLLLGNLLAHAQGGPPFRTDDPDTPGNKHLEINFGMIADRNITSAAYQVPDLDLNYGLGDRIQLKYEVPLAVQQTLAQPAATGQPATTGSTIAGLGESLPGIKWRFYEHHPNDPYFHGRFGTGLLTLFGHHPEPGALGPVLSLPKDGTRESTAPGQPSEPPETNFSLGTYPQLYLNNPTRSVARGLVPSGPNFYLPIEINGRIGPIRYNADAGYNFGNRHLPQSWNRGFILGHEFSDRTEAYVELYDLQDANRISRDDHKQRETTIGLGGRQTLKRDKTLNLLLMGGRSFQSTSPTNTQPKWIAYVGLQAIFGPKDKQPIAPNQVEQKLPNQSRP